VADRARGRAATLIVDIPGLQDDDDVTISISDPAGTAIVTDEEAENVGGGRATFGVTAEQHVSAGVYVATWGVEDGEVEQTYTVGTQALSGMTRYDLRYQVAERATKAFACEVSSAGLSGIADHALIGGANNYVGWWVLMSPPSLEMGLGRRVTGFNGSSLELHTSFVEAPSIGEPFVLMQASPRDVDRAIASALADLGATARIKFSVPDVAVDEDFIFTAPRGFTHLSDLWVDDVQVSNLDWSLLPGRRVLVDGIDEDDLITVVGTRDAGIPVWDDSVLDIEPSPVIARAAMALHAMRAGGPGRDLDEHLRRQLAAQDEFERNHRRVAGRVATGSRRLIE
jgi:hypothetical protein